MKLNEEYLAPVITHYNEGDKYSTFMQVQVTKEKEQKMYPLSSVIIYSSNPHPYRMLESVGELIRKIPKLESLEMHPGHCYSF